MAPIVTLRVAEQTGKPGLVIEVDHNAPRAHDDEAIQARIQTFMEGLKERARA
jgi:benzoyl-CoA reductase/2-hydroxyglutaryl-CoA dehydratase subunit BcrC/BadD/HgdB